LILLPSSDWWGEALQLQKAYLLGPLAEPASELGSAVLLFYNSEDGQSPKEQFCILKTQVSGFR
jgi:hypothetical protein